MQVFFYGLFMDEALLQKKGVRPSNPENGCLHDYALRIGKRASLVPCKNEKAYGIVMTIDEEAVRKLYSEASVADYIPEEVTIISSAGDSLPAICYNLPPGSLSGTNESYARSLYGLAKRKGFPTEYLEKIRELSTK